MTETMASAFEFVPLSFSSVLCVCEDEGSQACIASRWFFVGKVCVCKDKGMACRWFCVCARTREWLLVGFMYVQG